ncbi:site-specific integrase [Labrys neptuniae]
MPREALPPRLWWRKPRRAKAGRSAEKGVWVILHNGSQISTGCGKSDRKGAERTLADFITNSHRAPRRQRGLAEIPVADVLNIYLQDVVPTIVTARKAAGRIERLIDWWGDKMLDEVTGGNCRKFVESRTKIIKDDKGNPQVVPAPGGARRELQDLQSAINYHHREGWHREEVLVSLPKAGEARHRWLQRWEVAALLRVCLHTPEVQEGKPTDKRPLKHLARFILFGLYTGSRPGDIMRASFRVASDRSVIDLERGLFYRKPAGKSATKKRQPTTPLPSRLMAHLRRWHASGAEFVVEFDGAPVSSVKTAFYSMLSRLYLEDGIIPYTLRHTCCTWQKQRGVPSWEVAGFVGTSEAMIEKHYGHHDPNYLRTAAEANTQRSPNDKPRTSRENTARSKTKLRVIS